MDKTVPWRLWLGKDPSNDQLIDNANAALQAVKVQDLKD